MRYWTICASVGLTAGLVLTMHATRAAAVEAELFAVDVGPLVATFSPSQIVSDPPIIEASFYQMDTSPHVAVPEGVEAYLAVPATPNNQYQGYQIIGQREHGKPFRGSLFLLRRHPEHPSKSVLAKFDFDVGAAPSVRPTRGQFLSAKGLFFQRLWSEEMAGSAMFRHLATESLNQIGETARSTGPNWPSNPRSGVDQTIALMSGGRSVSENLQLDQQLEIPESDDASLRALADVRGISIQPINWGGLLSQEPPELDPLSRLVPHDQYAMYLPSFSELTEIVDRGGEIAQPVVQWFEPQSRKRDVLSFYQNQMGLPLDDLTRRLGGVLIGEIAVTGSDPYFRTGTDVAILMRSEQPELLHSSLLAGVGVHAAKFGDANRTELDIDKHSVTQWSTDDRALSSFVARIDDVVIVSNSLFQMRQVLKCADGDVKAMRELDEYRFFRQRYARDSHTQRSLIVITDAAIRRWCGPQWRIAASRRTRARATIAEVTMQHADDLVQANLKEPQLVPVTTGMPRVSRMFVSSRGVRSERYGTLQFQTPIAELQITSASNQEVELYERWRNQYESRWRQVFDPIALELTLDATSIHADLSVIPLIARSDYQQLLQLAGAARLKPEAGDPHPEMLSRISIAIDNNSPLLQLARVMIANGAAEINLLSWIDDSISVYVDSDPEWIRRLESQSPWELSGDGLIRDFPIGILIPSKDNMRLAAFVVAMRATLQRTAPNLIDWQTVDYKGFQYNVGTSIRGNSLGNAESMPRLYYITTGKGLTFSLNPRVVERAIERHLIAETPSDLSPDSASRSSAVANDQSIAPLDPQLTLETSGRGLQIMTRLNYQAGLRQMHRIAWSNLPILNYFRQRYPDRDPIQVYLTLFGETLQEPSGGVYVWETERRTYVSTLQGFHLDPKAGPAIAPILEPNDQIRTTVSFQDGGLRATFDLRNDRVPSSTP